MSKSAYKICPKVRDPKIITNSDREQRALPWSFIRSQHFNHKLCLMSKVMVMSKEEAAQMHGSCTRWEMWQLCPVHMTKPVQALRYHSLFSCLHFKCQGLQLTHSSFPSFYLRSGKICLGVDFNLLNQQNTRNTLIKNQTCPEGTRFILAPWQMLGDWKEAEQDGIALVGLQVFLHTTMNTLPYFFPPPVHQIPSLASLSCLLDANNLGRYQKLSVCQ